MGPTWLAGWPPLQDTVTVTGAVQSSATSGIPFDTGGTARITLATTDTDSAITVKLPAVSGTLVTSCRQTRAASGQRCVPSFRRMLEQVASRRQQSP